MKHTCAEKNKNYGIKIMSSIVFIHSVIAKNDYSINRNIISNKFRKYL